MPSLPSPRGRRAPSPVIPSPGPSLSLPSHTRSALLGLAAQVLHHCGAQGTWAGRRAAQETGKGHCQLLHTPAQHPGHSEGFTPTSAGTQQHSWHLPTPERDPGLFWPFHQASWHTCGRVGTVCNLTKGCNRRIQQKKAKTYKTSSWNTYSKMINHANAA